MSTMSTPSTSFNTISDFSFDEKLEEEEEEEKKEEGNELKEKKEPEKEEEKREFSCGKDEKEEEKGDKGGKAENKEVEFNLETSPAFTICIDNNVNNEVFILNARKSLDESAGFLWTIKKRLAFDDGSWKQLNRRIAALKAEVK